MTVLLIGLNHRTAPVELREQMALTGCALTMALEDLQHYRHFEQLDANGQASGAIHEGVILSTCNRLEVYTVVENPEVARQRIEIFLAQLQNIPLKDVVPHLYCLRDTDAVRHLMRVVCGLDSMILGEPQILGQVTQAFGDAQDANLTGSILSHLFSQAIHAGKRAHTETDISRFTTSVSHAGARMVMDRMRHLETPNVLVVGAGEMAVLAAKALVKHNTLNLAFINRTHSRAQSLAAEVGGEALSWHQLGEALQWADAVITATGAPHTVIYAADVEMILEARGNRKLLLMDIAVPRDIEVAVGDLPGVQRFDIDDLQSIVDSNTAQREAAVPAVELIIEQEITNFLEWHYSREVTPVIHHLRRWATQVAQMEVDQALNKLSDGDDEHTAKVVNRLAHRIVNKLLHEPTVRLRGQAVDGNGHGYAHAVSELFGLQVTQCDNRTNHCHNPGGVPDASCNLQCISPERNP